MDEEFLLVDNFEGLRSEDDYDSEDGDFDFGNFENESDEDREDDSDDSDFDEESDIKEEPEKKRQKVQMDSDDDLPFVDDFDHNKIIKAELEKKRQEIEKKNHFEVLSSEDIDRTMSELIKEVLSFMPEIQRNKIRILLSHFKWDKERLIERFYTGDKKAMFQEARVIFPDDRVRMTADECDICCLPKPRELMTGLECDHLFCTQCWAGYLTTKIEGSSQRIECPGVCDIIVDDELVMRTLINDPRAQRKYQQIIINSFVQSNKLIRWCPSAAGCSRAIRVRTGFSQTIQPVRCDCGHSFCFKCGGEDHEPVRCDLLEKWMRRREDRSIRNWIEKCDDVSEREMVRKWISLTRQSDINSKWIQDNTKPCPRCGVSIEKDGGCSEMTCRLCSTVFCWLCLRPDIVTAERELLRLGTSHGCSRVEENYISDDDSDDDSAHWDNDDDSEDDNEDEDVAHLVQTGPDLQRVIFHCKRFMNHHESIEKVKAKMEEKGKALDVLLECLKTLKYSYVFTYFLGKNNQSAIFEDNLNHLETATEKLSHLVENGKWEEIPKRENLLDSEFDIQSRYCENRRKALLGHVQEGYDKDWWLYARDPDSHGQ